ncbi:hypothetical protein B4U79_17252 [Dinothrombium tinctorium]|uniref:C2H2-type domain-containing protein n=1 Tax=Dinothrombium tinctorium TaxID=1965070 RepID=A0A3S3PRE4_9ACAR|nr:hypothetical protein B4U79_17253 [Dinothrombium tinctorium]RWS15015.1 hypothetical protein B4U79_17252 [Dinothrombium tinctorium]
MEGKNNSAKSSTSLPSSPSPPKEDKSNNEKSSNNDKAQSKFIYQGKEYVSEEDNSENGESHLLTQLKSEPKSEDEVEDEEEEEDDEDMDDENQVFQMQQNIDPMSLPSFADAEAEMLSEKGICPICHVTCKSKTGVQIHIGHAHREIDEFQANDEEKANVICKCGKTFSKHSKNLLRNHRQKCPAFRKAGNYHIKSWSLFFYKFHFIAFICEICESPFISMPALTTHLIAIHGVTKEANSCICGQTFGSRGSCRKHAITCQAYKNAAIFCHDCDLPFLTNGHLKQHLRTPSHRQMVKKRRK